MWAAWYGYDRGFTRKWRGYVSDEFRKRGVELTLRRLTLDPFRGLVAREVKVFDARDRRRTLAQVDEMILGLNYANLLRGKPFLDSVDLRDARLAMPLDPRNPRGPALEIARLDARVFLPPEQIYLARAEADLYGVRLSASGRVLHPDTLRKKSKGAKPDLAWLGRLLGELKALRWEGARPQLNVRFSGDLDAPDKMIVEAKLAGENLQLRGYRLARVDCTAALREGTAEIQLLRLQDARGVLEATASLRMKTQTATLRVRSGLDLPALLRAAEVDVPALREVVLEDPPALEATGEVTLGDPWRWQTLGRVTLGRFRYRDIPFERLTTDLSADGARWSLRDAHLVHLSGELRGDALQLPGKFRAKGECTIDPVAVAPLLGGKTAEWLQQWKFQKSPSFSIEATGPSASLDACTLRAEVAAGPFVHRDIPGKRLTASLRYAGRVLTVAPFRVEREEGSGSGELSVHFAQDEVRLNGVETTLHPSEAAGWVSTNLPRDMAPYLFGGTPPRLLVNGRVHTKGGSSTHLTVDVVAPGGMDYTFLKRPLHFDEIGGRLVFSPGKVQLQNVQATLFGGTVRGKAEIPIGKKEKGYQAALELDGVDFASLTKLYFNYDNSQGRLAGRYQFRGQGGDSRAQSGIGDLRVTQGNVFAIPFLGPLSGALNSIVPGMGYNVARKASATFQVGNGAITTGDLEIEGTGFSMHGNGKLFFVDDRMDFSMRVNAQGLPGVLLFPVSKLFEFVADEKLSKPVWRSRVLPKF